MKENPQISEVRKGFLLQKGLIPSSHFIDAEIKV